MVHGRLDGWAGLPSVSSSPPFFFIFFFGLNFSSYYNYWLVCSSLSLWPCRRNRWAGINVVVKCRLKLP